MAINEKVPEQPKPVMGPLSPSERQSNVNTARRLADYGILARTDMTLVRGSDVLEILDEMSDRQRHIAQTIKEIMDLPDANQQRARLALLLDELSQ